MYLCKNVKLLIYKHTHTHTFIYHPTKSGKKSLAKVKDKLLFVLKSQILWAEVNLFDVSTGIPLHFGKYDLGQKI